MPVESLSDEQAEAYGAFAEEPTRPELERFFFLDDVADVPHRAHLEREPELVVLRPPQGDQIRAMMTSSGAGNDLCARACP
ncbi:hypothetical protein [Streptomyces sp. 11-1-2]|uniref:hypothetical protein n=1 Tax=unclassified Streptomyces TaxID=2593676 RepID=UPI000B8D4A00|nr:hypothetical protein [Streptomyces sp. 11-1-2]ASQ96463.1 hypothetical protein CGL27_28450 [Streptomyces sp. 11-1-2]